MRSRWTHKKKPKDDDTFTFVPSDLDLLKLFAVGFRKPYAYRYLTSLDIIALSKRQHLRSRLRKLVDHDYLKKPEQPRNNYRAMIYQLGKNGVRELLESGYVAKETNKELPHEVLANSIAASFELSGTPEPIHYDERVWPDWPPFRFNGFTIFIEADLKSEPHLASDKDRTDIAGKIEAYIDIVQKYENARVLFVTLSPTRANNMIEKALKPVFDNNDIDHDLAEHFCFGAVDYSRYLDRVIKPSDWVTRMKFKRAGFDPFSFKEGGGVIDREADRALQGLN